MALRKHRIRVLHNLNHPNNWKMSAALMALLASACAPGGTAGEATLRGAGKGDRAAPATAAAVTAISAGTTHTCAVTASGTLACWGGNRYGQLGDGTTVDRATPAPVMGLASKVTSVVAAFEYTCALLDTGAVQCFGGNPFGQLGDGTTTDRNLPVKVALPVAAKAITAGWGQTCALGVGGELFCWGRNEWGAVGDGTLTNRPSPVSIALGPVAQISAGSAHTCALLQAGGVKCWGFNGEGELGIGATSAPQPTPVATVGLPAHLTALEAGSSHTCVLDGDAGLYCWGYNFQGQLGDGTQIARMIAVPVPGLPESVLSLSAGTDRTLALLDSGQVWSWGWNAIGGLGDGTTADRHSPARMAELPAATAVTSGENHSCAITADGAAWCWGGNQWGQVGDGTTKDRYTPVPVTGL